MEKTAVAALIDDTILKAVARREDIERLCAEAKSHGFASVCVNPVHVPLAARLLAGSEVAVCTVVGFPLGATSSPIKAAEAAWTVAQGATEVDMMIDIGAAKEGRFDDVEADIAAVVQASKDALVKVILEVCYLSDAEIVACCQAAVRAGAHFVKTSTGKIPVAATPEAAVVMCTAIRDYYQKTGRKVGFKAAGGIRSAEEAALFYTIVEEILGKEWCSPALWRIGASSLANGLISAIVGEQVKYF